MYRPYQHGSIDGQQYQIPANNTPFVYSGYQTPMMPPGQNLQPSSQHLSPSLQPMPIAAPGHSRHASNGSNGPPTRHSRSPSPRIRLATPSQNEAWFVPTDRSLPSKHVTAENITDAYVAFILYCNPNFTLDVNTTTLATNFQSPPKSDNKDFEVFRLFELIKKFDAKEIKTWGQLALDLGVEAPDVSKGQSVQKVQQYSVRLKRWMRAMHVDAFFEFLLGKPHSYYQEIPHPDDPYSAPRDGVMPEEDLAVRALDPSFRPKRGRRRNSEAEQDDESTVGADHAHPSAQVPQSAYPASAYPSANMSFTAASTTDPWGNPSAIVQHDFAPWMSKLEAPQSAIVTSAPSHVRWQNPATPHPMTALPGSMHAHIDAALNAEPKSAITPSSRKRRKHGPAVSSAWPSTNAPGAKPRGRPPVSRNVQNGPFTTFPADPANEKSSQSLTISSASAEKRGSSEAPQSALMAPSDPQRQGDGLARPGRLSLQVPPHIGGPVRLATPPRVMVTNETSESEQSIMDNATVPQYDGQPSAAPQDREIPGFAFETLQRVVASDLLRASLIGREQRLTGDEAKRLADAILQRFNVPKGDTDSPQDDIARLTAASWLGVGEQLNVPLGPATGHGKRLTVTRFRTDAEGDEEVVSAQDMYTAASREEFDFSWSVTMGGCNGFFELKGLSLTDPRPKPWDVHDATIDSWTETARRMGIDEERVQRGKQKYAESGKKVVTGRAPGSEENVDWKAKYQALEFGSRMAKGEFVRYRERLIEKVLDTLI